MMCLTSWCVFFSTILFQSIISGSSSPHIASLQGPCVSHTSTEGTGVSWIDVASHGLFDYIFTLLKHLEP